MPVSPGWEGLKAKPVQVRHCPATVNYTQRSKPGRPLIVRFPKPFVERKWNMERSSHPLFPAHKAGFFVIAILALLLSACGSINTPIADIPATEASPTAASPARSDNLAVVRCPRRFCPSLAPSQPVTHLPRNKSRYPQKQMPVAGATDAALPNVGTYRF